MQNNFLTSLKASLATFLLISFCSCDNPQNFDKVTPPALPNGWTSSGIDGQKWITVSEDTVDRPSDTPPNSAFVPSFNNQDVSLTSPLITLGNGGSSEISFKHRCKTENQFDGMILELSVNGVPFFNIENYGPFLEGPYGNLAVPVSGISRAWSGESNYVLTRIALPNYLPNTSLQFRFRSVSDNSVSKTGCSLDSLNFNGADLLVTTVESKDPISLNEELTYTVTVKNQGPLAASNINLVDILPSNFSLSSVTLSQGIFNVSTAPVLNASIGNLAVGQTATISIKGKTSVFPVQAAVVQLFNPDFVRNISATSAAFGSTLQQIGLKSNLIIANDGSGDAEDACQAFPSGSVTSGDTVLIRQSNNCSFNQQVKNAELAGAAAAIIYNSTNDQLTSMGSSGIAVSIPSAFIGNTDGTYLHQVIFGPNFQASLISVPNNLVNEVVAVGSVFDTNITNNFSTELTSIAPPDSDGDGVVDTLDLCPSNNIKINPGICGCSIQDLDLNINGAADCLPSADLKAQAQKLQKALSALKLIKVNASTKEIDAQKLVKKNLKLALDGLTKIIKISGASINILSNKIPLKTQGASIKSSVSLTLKLKSSFANDKKAATKSIKNLLKTLN